MSDEVKQEGSQDLKRRLASLYLYLSEHLGIQAPPSKVTFTENKENSSNPFGLTGYYDPATKQIRLYITDRHDTDILRSFAHEVIHHWQNERGTLTKQNEQSKGAYAQEDPNLRKREMEAYLFGNILFRDWQDENRYGPPATPPVLPQPLNENLMLQSAQLKNKLQNFVNDLVTSGTLGSFHRSLTSGDMKAKDFANDLIHQLLSSIRDWMKTVNDRGNWENDEGGMIKEVSCKKCGNKCDPSSINEVSMGLVRCPACNEKMDQEGNVYGR